MEERCLHQPLLPIVTATATTTTIDDIDDGINRLKFLSSNSDIFFRILSVTLIGLVCIWANYEASKGFQVTIINDAKGSSAGQRFNLFYVSNDKATRIVLNASSFVENMLYSNTNQSVKKPVKHIVLNFARENFTQIVRVNSIKDDQYVIYMSHSIMEETSVDYAIKSAIQRAMARIWLWNGSDGSTALPPPQLIDGVVEFISTVAGFGGESKFDGGKFLPIVVNKSSCWEDKDPKVVANFLTYCELREKGFIQRLNLGIRDGWDHRTVDDSVGISYFCNSYKKTFL